MQTNHATDEHLSAHRVTPDVVCIHAEDIHAFFAVARPPQSDVVRRRKAAAERLKEAFREYRALTA